MNAHRARPAQGGYLRPCCLLLSLLFLLAAGGRAFAAATLAKGATMQILGVGTAALLGADLTDPENDGIEGNGPADPSWNWTSISSNAEPGFGGGEYSYNVFDNLGEGGGNNKWCCGEPMTPATLAANPLAITVRLNDRYRLTHFTITSGNDTPARDPRDFQILGSNDGYNFEPIFTQIGTGTGATTTTNGTTGLWGTTRNQVNQFTLDQPARPYTFIRFSCSATYSTPPFTTATAFFQITEIEYFGLQGGALTVEPLGTGTAALLKGDQTDPENDGKKASGPADPSWNWKSIAANNKAHFGDDGAFNVFDNAVDGATSKWCCDDATAANPLNVTVEFANGLALTHFTIANSDGDPSADPTKFQILGSNDGTAFTPIYTRDSATSLWTARNQVLRIDLADPSPPYKFIRYEATETPGPTHAISEIEYFGKFGGVNVPLISDVTAAASFALLQVTDGTDTRLVPESAKLVIDSQPAATTANKVGTVTTLTHVQSPVYASGSTHTWSFTALDDAGNPLTRAGSFTVAAYTTISAAYALASAADPGFRAKVNQLDIYRNPATGVPANAERQLADGYLDPGSGLPYLNSADLTTAGPDGRIVVPTVVNWNSTVGGASGAFGNDEAVPGIPGAGVSPTDRYVVAIETILELKAGVSYRFAVNSDDGFRLSFGWGAGDVGGTQLGTAGDRGFAESRMDVIVPSDGFYPVRLMYWETGGGDGCEFYTVDIATGERILVNDASNPRAVKAYQTSTVSRPYVSRTLPSVNYGYAFADQDVIVDITDGANPLTPDSVILRINGTDQTLTSTKQNSVTTVRRASSLANLLPAGANNVTLIYGYSSNGVALLSTNTWAYTVPAYTRPIPPANKVSADQVAGVGFKVKAVQIDRSLDANQGNGGRYTGNGGGGANMPRPEIELNDGYINLATGLPFANLAAAGPNPDRTFDIAEVLNFNNAQSTGGPAVNAGIFNADAQVPGLPGTGTSNFGLDNTVHEITTYLELKAGAHIFGLNVDDGWLCISAPNPLDTLGTLLGFRNGPGGQNGNPVNNPNAAFNVLVLEDGIYPFRILFWQGGGGVNLEFLEVDRATGTQILVNDTAGTYPSVVNFSGNTISGVVAYNAYTGPARPWVKASVYPMPYIGVTNPQLNGGNAVTLWQNQHQQSGPGPITVKVGGGNPADIANDSAATRPFGDAVGAVVADLGNGTVGMVLDGANVTPTVSAIPNSTDKLVLYTPPTPLSNSSNHIAGLVYAGTTNWWIFNVISNVTVDASAAVPRDRLDATKIGFRAKVAQASAARAGGNTAAAAESQLAGTPANVAIPGPEPDGAYLVPGTINWNVAKNPGNTTGETGNFQPARTGTPDEAVPGIPGTGLTGAARYENFTAEIFAWLDLPAGYQKFAVNGDDGWKVQIGRPGRTDGQVLFTVDRGAGNRDIPFAFVTPQAGLYPVRLVFYQGGGGGNVEFFSYGPNNEKVLINDRNNANAIKAYYNVVPLRDVTLTIVSGPGDGKVTLSWTGSGTLVEASSLSTPASWKQSANQANPQTITATGTKYYQVVQ